MKQLQKLFEDQVVNNPSAIALDAIDKQFTYEQLSFFSNRIGHKLQEAGAKPNTLIAIVMEKGWEQVAAVLGILKSGAAYLPIDPTESEERIFHLLKIGEVQLILTQTKLMNERIWPSYTRCFAVDDDNEWISYPTSIPAIEQNLAHLAYVIFTSGTTGIPKGVMIDHQGAVNTILDINYRFKISNADKVLAISALHFDLSVYDIFGTLAAGGTLVIPSACESINPRSWIPIFLDKKISICNCVPPLFQAFIACLLQSPQKNNIPSHLRLVLLSGDWIPTTLPAQTKSLMPEIEMISLGGATEASIWSILYPITDIVFSQKSIPYGKPMNNQSFYILNEGLMPVSLDEPGELYIGGIGLAKGYWRDECRTEASFITHPHLGKLYKTGDLGRYLPDGNIEFLGRIDFQVKIHGFRVETSAIETCLLEHPAVQQAAVIAVGKEFNKRLIAYLVLKKDRLKSSELISRIHIAQWHAIHDGLTNTQSTQSIHVNPVFNTLGWTSSFSGTPIAQEQMQEWVDETVNKILRLEPKRILEVGCGLGLLLFQIAPKVKEYDAADYSERTIKYVKNQVDDLRLSNVRLFTGEAKCLNFVNTTLYDTIVINSVIQYFSGMDYFCEVLREIIQHVKPGGKIFIGDIRNIIHLRIFHIAKQLFKIKKETSFLEFKTTVDRHVNDEEELLIDHRFFQEIRKQIPRISAVDVQLKRGHFLNEMTCYRYDVVLYLDHDSFERTLEIDWVNWQLEKLDLTGIENFLESEPNYFSVKNIANKRIVNLEEILEEAKGESVNWFNSFKKKVVSLNKSAMDPNDLYQLADKRGYEVSISWSRECPTTCFDVIFSKKSVKKKIVELDLKETESRDLESYANVPVKSKIINKIFSNLNKYLQTKLPKYMVPQTFINLDKLPLNSNGKIDRQALVSGNVIIKNVKYVPPKTAIEKKLAKIWQEVLNIEKISVNENFYEIGGTSLLAIIIINKIDKSFAVHLTIGEFILHSPTIQALAELIKERIPLNMSTVSPSLEKKSFMAAGRLITTH